MSPRPNQRQQVVDPGHHCNYSQVPHLLLQHVAQGELPPSAVVLYLHYVQLSWTQHGKPIQETLRDAGLGTGLSNGTILTARESLAKKGWIGCETQGLRRHQLVTITLLDRWQENCPGHDLAYGQNSSNAEAYAQKLTTYAQKPAIAGRKLSIGNLKTVLKTEDVKDLSQQHAREEDNDDVDRAVPLPRLLTRVPDDPADELVAAFYRGLGQDVRTLTRPLLRREQVVARDLIGAGATPSEAEAFAHDVAADDRRRAPVDGLRTFERERVSWHSRRSYGQREGPRLVDRSGQVPEWELPVAAGGGS